MTSKFRVQYRNSLGVRNLPFRGFVAVRGPWKTHRVFETAEEATEFAQTAARVGLRQWRIVKGKARLAQWL